jgi:hypothetical protein
MFGGSLAERLLTLRLSFQVTSLLRPSFPYAFTVEGNGFILMESFRCSIQAALFVLALRLRMKR